MNSTLAQSMTPPINEPYMNPRQLEYFQTRLLKWRADLIETNRLSLVCMTNRDMPPIEEIERSVQAADLEIVLKNQARNTGLIRMIDQALERIKYGTYGYCQHTDEPIGFERLDANPVAQFCLNVQSEFEQRGHGICSVMA